MTVEVVDPEGGRAFDRRQWITLGVIAALIVSVLVFGANVGLAAFVAPSCSLPPARRTMARRSS